MSLLAHTSLEVQELGETTGGEEQAKGCSREKGAKGHPSGRQPKQETGSSSRSPENGCRGCRGPSTSNDSPAQYP